MSYVIERVPVRHGSRQLTSEQRQAYNRGVGLCLDAASARKKPPSKYDLHGRLTKDRAHGILAPNVTTALQRPGLETGREAVVMWSDARWRLDQRAVYCAVRLAAEKHSLAGDSASAKLLLKAVDNKAAPKDGLKKEKEYCKRRLASEIIPQPQGT